MKEYTQAEIDLLIKCPKVIINPPKREMALIYGHLRNGMDLESEDGLHRFTVFMRINETFLENFTIGLDYVPKDRGGRLCLLRCNGPHGEHSNNRNFDAHYGYHIHKAIAKYINKGLKSDIYAELTEEYATYNDALIFFLKYCNIRGAEKYIINYRQLSLQNGLGDMESEI